MLGQWGLYFKGLASATGCGALEEKLWHPAPTRNEVLQLRGSGGGACVSGCSDLEGRLSEPGEGARKKCSPKQELSPFSPDVCQCSRMAVYSLFILKTFLSKDLKWSFLVIIFTVFDEERVNGTPHCHSAGRSCMTTSLWTLIFLHTLKYL